MFTQPGHHVFRPYLALERMLNGVAKYSDIELTPNKSLISALLAIATSASDLW